MSNGAKLSIRFRNFDGEIETLEVIPAGIEYTRRVKRDGHHWVFLGYDVNSNHMRRVMPLDENFEVFTEVKSDFLDHCEKTIAKLEARDK